MAVTYFRPTLASSHENLFLGEGKSGLTQMSEAIEELVDEKYVLDVSSKIQGYCFEVYYLR